MKDKCHAEKEGICMSMLCLIDYDCPAKDSKGKPRYDHEIGLTKAERNKKGE